MVTVDLDIIPIIISISIAIIGSIGFLVKIWITQNNLKSRIDKLEIHLGGKIDGLEKNLNFMASVIGSKNNLIDNVDETLKKEEI